MSKITVSELHAMKARGERIVALTSYDAAFARILDSAGVDIQLVGDSLGMVLQGRTHTTGVSMRDMIYHTCCVTPVCKRSFVVADMPFHSYATPAQALGNAARLVAEADAEMVKLEGGAWLIPTVRRLAEQGIAVCGHVGLQPQSVHRIGGYRVQGGEPQQARVLRDDALALEAAGCQLMLLECVDRGVAEAITAELTIPVIGIGSGPHCDGQILVLHDILGISGYVPSFAQNFLAGNDSVDAAVMDFIAAVRDGRFPAR